MPPNQQPHTPYPGPSQPRPAQYPQYQPPTPPPVHRRSLWDKIWKDKKGSVVIWQNPNVFLIGWAVLTTLALFFPRRPGDILAAVGLGILIIWCLLEIFRGVNYFRRALGLAVLAYAVSAVLHWL